MMEMKTDCTIFVVEDDLAMRFLLASALGDRYAVEAFDSAENCLARLAEKQPDIFLIDVGLPGINGYDLCRRLKSLPGSEAIAPVVFISTYDRLDDVLAGYDAGGDDYIVKPFDVVLLERKIEHIRRVEHEKKCVLEQAKSSEELASLVLANLDEYAVLIRFLRSLNDCDNPRQLSALLFKLLAGYGLDAAIQLRLPGSELTIGKEGDNHPLEVAIIRHVRDMDRIFEFKKRAAYNYERITILVNNMPVDNPELCGRIRDSVLIAAECANAKLLAVQTSAENNLSKATAARLLEALRTGVQDFEQKYAQARYSATLLTQEMLDQLAEACASLGLSDDQEARIDSIIRSRVSLLAESYDLSDETQATLTDIATQLADILSPATATAIDPATQRVERVSEPQAQTVELF